RLVSEAGDPAVTPRPEFVSSLSALLLERLGPPMPAPRRMSRLLIGSGLAGLAAVVAALALLLLRPATAGAQVAKALQEQPWIRGRIFEPGGKAAGETWYSPRNGVIAFQRGGEAEYHDHALDTFTKYVAAEGVIYRLPESPERRSHDLEFYRQLLDPN